MLSTNNSYCIRKKNPKPEMIKSCFSILIDFDQTTTYEKTAHKFTWC